jgi:hypothetical protein
MLLAHECYLFDEALVLSSAGEAPNSTLKELTLISGVQPQAHL